MHEAIVKRRNIDKLSKDDIAKLSLIHSSIGTADSFDSWFEESIASKKTPRVLILIFIINYITLVFFMGAPLILSLIPLTIAYLVPVIIFTFIMSLTKRIPFFFYLKIKLKIYFLS